MTETLASVRGIENLSPGGRRATVDVSKSLGIDPDWLVSIMSFETAGTFSPKQKNAAGSGATGLIQFMPSTAAGLGYTISQLMNMSQEEQIRGPVYKYFANKGKLRTLDDVYLAVFYPAAIGQPDSYKIPAWAYPQNKGLDIDKDGNITKREITAVIRSVYNSAKNKPRVEVPGSDFFRIAILFSLFGLSAFYIVNWGTRGKAGREVKQTFHVTNPTAVKLLS